MNICCSVPATTYLGWLDCLDFLLIVFQNQSIQVWT
jgi:hypothetical protein